jgi:hypothetical protein
MISINGAVTTAQRSPSYKILLTLPRGCGDSVEVAPHPNEKKDFSLRPK